MRIKTLFGLTPFVMLMVGCGTQRLSLNHSLLPVVTEKRNGSLAVRFIDKRNDKQAVGAYRNGFGGKMGDLAVADLESSLAQIFTETIERAGYSVVPEAPVTLH